MSSSFHSTNERDTVIEEVEEEDNDDLPHACSLARSLAESKPMRTASTNQTKSPPPPPQKKQQPPINQPTQSANQSTPRNTSPLSPKLSSNQLFLPSASISAFVVSGLAFIASTYSASSSSVSNLPPNPPKDKSSPARERSPVPSTSSLSSPCSSSPPSS